MSRESCSQFDSLPLTSLTKAAAAPERRERDEVEEEERETAAAMEEEGDAVASAPSAPLSADDEQWFAALDERVAALLGSLDSKALRGQQAHLAGAGTAAVQLETEVRGPLFCSFAVAALASPFPPPHTARPLLSVTLR